MKLGSNNVWSPSKERNLAFWLAHNTGHTDIDGLTHWLSNVPAEVTRWSQATGGSKPSISSDPGTKYGIDFDGELLLVIKEQDVIVIL